MKLDSWEDCCDAHMLKAAGVYAILDEDNEVMYVGESECFIRRWGDHCNKARPDRTVPFKLVFQFVILAYEDDRDKRKALEAAYSLELKPKYGRHHGARNYPLYRSFDNKQNPYKIRSLRKQGLLNPKPRDPIADQLFEDSNFSDDMEPIKPWTLDD